MAKYKCGTTEQLEKNAELLTQSTYLYYLERIMNLKLSCYKWSGLPKEIDERFIEWVLITQGCGLFFFEDNPNINSYVFTKTALGGDFDINDTPNYRMAYSINNDITTKELNESNSVICWNKRTRSSDMNQIYMFAERLTNITRIIDMNIEMQRTQSVIVTNAEERATALSLMKKLFNYVPIIIGRKSSVATKPIEIVTPDIKFIADKCTDILHDKWNEFLTANGFNNANTDKKERMITSEADSNIGEIFAGRWSQLVERKKACEKLNDMFDLSVDVEWRGEEEILKMDSEFSKGGVASAII